MIKNGQLVLPNHYDVFCMMNNNFQYHRKWCFEDLEKLA